MPDTLVPGESYVSTRKRRKLPQSPTSQVALGLRVGEEVFVGVKAFPGPAPSLVVRWLPGSQGLSLWAEPQASQCRGRGTLTRPSPLFFCLEEGEGPTGLLSTGVSVHPPSESLTVGGCPGLGGELMSQDC